MLAATRTEAQTVTVTGGPTLTNGSGGSGAQVVPVSVTGSLGLGGTTGDFEEFTLTVTEENRASREVTVRIVRGT